MPPGELLLDIAPRLERLEGLDHVEVGNLLEFWKKKKLPINEEEVNCLIVRHLNYHRAEKGDS